jgi:hypothetical protein
MSASRQVALGVFLVGGLILFGFGLFWIGDRRQLFSESMPYFWRMFGLSLILALPVLVLVVVLAAGALAFIIPMSQNGGNGPAMGALAILPVMIGCFCLLIPIMFVLNMIFGQAQRAIVLEEMSIMPAISRGWDVFRNNLGPIILMLAQPLQDRLPLDFLQPLRIRQRRRGGLLHGRPHPRRQMLR